MARLVLNQIALCNYWPCRLQGLCFKRKALVVAKSTTVVEELTVNLVDPSGAWITKFATNEL
jgi:hypothetical protein